MIVPVPQFSRTMSDESNVVKTMTTEGSLWSALFDDGLSHGIPVDAFLNVIGSRRGLESVSQTFDAKSTPDLHQRNLAPNLPR
jgi:hypothetical protein